MSAGGIKNGFGICHGQFIELGFWKNNLKEGQNYSHFLLYLKKHLLHVKISTMGTHLNIAVAFIQR